MIKTGLVSITFRKLLPEDIIALVAKAGLDGIEWGGDIHVPHGDIQRAEEVYKMTEQAGLKVAAYGSYYKVGCQEKNNVEFERVIETAAALHTPTIRVWAGDKASRDADKAWRKKIVDESRNIAELAQKEGITVSFEYHGNTLTDTSESAYSLFKDINHKNIRSYWQPPVGLNEEDCLEGLNRVKPWLSNIHVYYWQSGNRISLDEGKKQWGKYIDSISDVIGERYMMLEFVKDDSPQQFLEDAETLKHLVSVKRK